MLVMNDIFVTLYCQAVEVDLSKEITPPPQKKKKNE